MTSKRAFRDEELYRVTLSSACTAAGIQFRPMHRYTVKGRIAKLIAEYIETAERLG